MVQRMEKDVSLDPVGDVWIRVVQQSMGRVMGRCAHSARHPSRRLVIVPMGGGGDGGSVVDEEDDGDGPW